MPRCLEKEPLFAGDFLRDTASTDNAWRFTCQICRIKAGDAGVVHKEAFKMAAKNVRSPPADPLSLARALNRNGNDVSGSQGRNRARVWQYYWMKTAVGREDRQN